MNFRHVPQDVLEHLQTQLFMIIEYVKRDETVRATSTLNTLHDGVWQELGERGDAQDEVEKISKEAFELSEAAQAFGDGEVIEDAEFEMVDEDGDRPVVEDDSSFFIREADDFLNT